MPNEILRVIANDQALKDVLRELLLKQFEPPKALTDLSATDETLGQATRARLTGLIAIEGAFREIEKYRTVRPEPLSQNPAR